MALDPDDIRDELDAQLALVNSALVADAPTRAIMKAALLTAIAKTLDVVLDGQTGASGHDFDGELEAGVDDHAALQNLAWNLGLHTLGTTDTLTHVAGWNAGGLPRAELASSFTGAQGAQGPAGNGVPAWDGVPDGHVLKIEGGSPTWGPP